jgi:hypothetical protein
MQCQQRQLPPPHKTPQTELQTGQLQQQQQVTVLPWLLLQLLLKR